MNADKPFLRIDDRKIGENFPPYIIAEISANHNGSLDNAKQIIRAAKMWCRCNQTANLHC